MRIAKFITSIIVLFLPFAPSARNFNTKSTSTGASGANERLQRKPPCGRMGTGTTGILKEPGSFEPLDLSDNRYRKMGEYTTGRLCDQATVFTLNGLANGKQDFQIAVEDQQILKEATAECIGQASAQIVDPDRNVDPDKSTSPSSTDDPNQDSNSSRQ